MAKDEKAPKQEPGEKISFQEFCVMTHTENLWHGGLQIHAGKEPRTLSEWKRVFEEFKNKPANKN